MNNFPLLPRAQLAHIHTHLAALFQKCWTSAKVQHWHKSSIGPRSQTHGFSYLNFSFLTHASDLDMHDSSLYEQTSVFFVTRLASQDSSALPQLLYLLVSGTTVQPLFHLGKEKWLDASYNLMAMKGS